MNNFSDQQLVQEKQYSFPEHYVPTFRKGFRTAVYSRYGLVYAQILEFILDQLGKISFDSLCDVGCGDGRLIKEIQTDFPRKQVLGMDYSERAINLARGLNPEGNYIQTDITEDQQRSFDVLTLIEVFEHIPPDMGEDFVRGLHRLLIDDGFLLLTVPHYNVPLEKKHYRHFTTDSLVSCFEPLFEITEVKYLIKN
ncbi:MAG: class I SAM-dependent methyltransferase, partial [Fibrobacterota bacterium]